jgi:hypothetical protein
MEAKKDDSRKDARHAKFGEIRRYYFFAPLAPSRDINFEVVLFNM